MTNCGTSPFVFLLSTRSSFDYLHLAPPICKYYDDEKIIPQNLTSCFFYTDSNKINMMCKSKEYYKLSGIKYCNFLKNIYLVWIDEYRNVT